MKFQHSNECLLGTHNCPENSYCSNYEYQDGYECVCRKNFYESPFENDDGSLDWTKMSCLPPRVKNFGNYSIEYVIFRTKSEYYSSRQMCAQIGFDQAQKEPG